MAKSLKNSSIKEHLYSVQGMHCASCEILIEKRLLAEKNIKAAEAMFNKGQVRIEYLGSRPNLPALNQIFKENNYTFSDYQPKKGGQLPDTQGNKSQSVGSKKNPFADLFLIGGISLLVILGFLFLSKSGLAALINVNSQSVLPAFLIFGLLAGFSSCAALIGGLILSMTKQWSELYSNEDSAWKKLQPNLLFNAGRLTSFALLGTLLGALGQTLKISPSLTSFLVIGVSIVMILLAGQMLGIRGFQGLQLTFPKSMTRFIADEKNFKGFWMPILMGALTFFLPCGFTLTSQGLALASGSPLRGGLIMFLFALGTLPALLLISFSGVKFTQRPHLSNYFLRIAGVLVLFFALFNINSQFNVLGLKNISDLNLGFGSAQPENKDFPPIVNGRQVIKMNASADGYTPNRFTVQAGIPVRWEINDTGTSGCTSAIISKSLFDGQINLTPGETSVKEFLPAKPGTYKFSCWMGMISGLIEVVDSQSPTGALNSNSEPVIDSGASGCGC